MDERLKVSGSTNRSPPPRGPGAFMVSWPGILSAFVLAVLTVLVFRVFPGLDLAAANAFYAGHGRFIGQTPGGGLLRQIFFDVPIVIAVVATGLYATRGLGRLWVPNGRGLVFLLVSLALGPGLLVNVVLKDHSHRPRPAQTDVFDGSFPFRPVGSFDGACAKNCSFVSGEGSSAFWTVAPALLVPASMQPLALAAALCFGTAASLLRMAFGGHYLSDTIMAALLVWLVVAGTWRLVMMARL